MYGSQAKYIYIIISLAYILYNYIHHIHIYAQCIAHTGISHQALMPTDPLCYRCISNA